MFENINVKMRLAEERKFWLDQMDFWVNEYNKKDIRKEYKEFVEDSIKGCARISLSIKKQLEGNLNNEWDSDKKQKEYNSKIKRYFEIK